MGTGYDGKPNEYPYGKFDYTLWTAGSEVTLCNVPWDAVYNSTVEFANGQAGLDAYINSRPNKTFTAMQNMYPFEDLRLNMTHSDASLYNYVRVRNSDMPVQGGKSVKTYYYFIDGVVPLAPEVAGMQLMLDVWQTYVYDVEFGNCYIDRSHLGIAAENNFDSFGRKYLTIPEGVDLGTDYQTIVKRSEKIMSRDPNSGSVVIVVSATDLTTDPGTVNSPNLVTAPGTTLQNNGSGASYYAFRNMDEFKQWLYDTQNYPWVTQGITAAFLMPSFERYVINPPSFAIPNKPWPLSQTNVLSEVLPRKTRLAGNWRNSPEWKNVLPSRYRHLKKFFTFPYMAIELTTWTGTPIILKPEVWNNEFADIVERASYIAPGQRVEVYAQGYNSPDGYVPENYLGMTDAQIDALSIPTPAKELLKRIGDDSGDYIDHATKIANFPSMAILNNASIGYLASNANSLAYARESAGWSAQRARMGEQTSFSNTLRGNRLNEELGDISANAAVAQNANATSAENNRFAANTISNIIGSATSGDPRAILQTGMSAASGYSNMVSSQMERSRATGISNSAASAATEAGNTAGTDIASANMRLGKWASRGDYQNAIAGIDAQVNDSKLMPPTTSGQVGGETINLAHDTVEVSCRWKMIDQASIRRIGDYWLRYGYAMNMFYRLDRLMVMSKFTYWKLLETHIVNANMPEPFKNTLRGILEKGVTVYRNPNDIGNIDLADNEPIGGITL